MIHLIFGAAATGSLKYALRNRSDKIIGFPIDFSVGPITNIHKQSGINHYFSWLKSSYHTVWGNFEEDQTNYRQSLQSLLEIEDAEQITIWVSENTSEQIGLRISCYLLKDKEVEIRLINTFDAMLNDRKNEDVQVHIRHTGECSPKQLAYFYMYSIQLIPEEIKNDFVQDGVRLLSGKSLVRSWQKGEIVDDIETRDDPFILKCAVKIHNEMPDLEFINTMRVIGEVIGNSEQPISDSWIEYRIRCLIHSNYLDYEGDLQSMKMYKIKVVQ